MPQDNKPKVEDDEVALRLTRRQLLLARVAMDYAAANRDDVVDSYLEWADDDADDGAEGAADGVLRFEGESHSVPTEEEFEGVANILNDAYEGGGRSAAAAPKSGRS